MLAQEIMCAYLCSPLANEQQGSAQKARKKKGKERLWQLLKAVKKQRFRSKKFIDTDAE